MSENDPTGNLQNVFARSDFLLSWDQVFASDCRMFSAHLASEIDFSMGSQSLIWIPETDTKGTVADPLFTKDRQGYFFGTYQSLIEEALASTVKTVATEPFVFETLSANRQGAREMYDALRKREALEAMPEDVHRFWEKRLLGYTFDHISEGVHESADTLNMRARRGVKEAIERLLGDENQSATISLLMDEENLSPEDERELLEAFEQVSFHAYPNSQRIGCPGPPFLEQLARDRRSISVRDDRLTHVARCSPCFQEFEALRDTAALRRARMRLLPIAAAVLIVTLWVTAYLNRDRFRTLAPGADLRFGEPGPEGPVRRERLGRFRKGAKARLVETAPRENKPDGGAAYRQPNQASTKFRFFRRSAIRCCGHREWLQARRV